jgi:SAM-dependent methyltransferase
MLFSANERPSGPQHSEGTGRMVEVYRVAEHYRADQLMGHVQSALKMAGLEDGLLTIEQLAPLDQFHSRGLAATIDLGRVVNPIRSTAILDIGSGLGGPSRYLAATYGCKVTGVDLSQSFVDTATYLARRVGLEDQVAYLCGSALSLPFPAEQFDIAWTQHVAMNISDRKRFYAEANRVLKPGGLLAIYDVLAGNGDLIYPVPWSRDARTSFLLTPDQMEHALELAGFEVRSWIDRTASGLEWLAKVGSLQAVSAAGATIGLHLAMGPEFKLMSANLGLNLAEGHAMLIEAVFEKIR